MVGDVHDLLDHVLLPGVEVGFLALPWNPLEAIPEELVTLVVNIQAAALFAWLLLVLVLEVGMGSHGVRDFVLPITAASSPVSVAVSTALPLISTVAPAGIFGVILVIAVVLCVSG